MRQVKFSRKNLWSAAIKMIAGSRTRALAFVLAVLTVGALVTAGVRAYTRAPSKVANAARPPIASRLIQHGGNPGKGVTARLSLQPEADRFRRRIGKRFVESGRERTILVGILTIGAEQHQVRIVRTQDDDGEQVEISLNGGPGSLTWNGRDGARSAGRVATGIERSLIERLALDSPDQFVLAQTRGASYYTVARNVVPEGAGNSDDYAGPVWDLVRIGEPDSTGQNKPQSTWRLYYINSNTGLIDKSFSREQGDPMLAEFSDWVKQGSELAPNRIRWSRKDQVVMDLVLSNIAQGPRQ